jgi:hypothetical protein
MDSQGENGRFGNASEAVKKLGAVDRPEGYLQNCKSLGSDLNIDI